MKMLVLLVALVPSLAFTQEKPAGTSSTDPMAGWVPPKLKNEAKDKQEIQGVYKAMEAAGRKGDLEAAAGLVDFPVTMLTDDSKGQGMGEAWSREQWTQVMTPFYAKPMKDVKVTHKQSVFLMSDSLAAVNDVATVAHAGKTITTRSTALLVRRDGEWRIKAMAEGGWGDMKPPEGSAAAGQGSPSGSSGEGVTGQGSPSGSSGEGSAPPETKKESGDGK